MEQRLPTISIFNYNRFFWIDLTQQQWTLSSEIFCFVQTRLDLCNPDSCVSVDDCHPLRCIRIPFPEFAGVFQIVLRGTLNLQTMEKAFQTGIVVTTTFGAHAAN